MITQTSIHALIKLLDDSDSMVVEHAQSKLLELGDELIPSLEKIESNCFTSPVQLKNVQKILHAVRFEKIKRELKKWLHSDDKNLLQAIHLICSYQYPELKRIDFTAKFQDLKHQCWMEINTRQTSFEKVNALNKVFFDDFDFVKVSRTPSSPFDIFVNSVLESKEGTDFTLGLIYSIVAQSLDIPVYGVSSSNKRVPFLLSYMDKENLLSILDWGINNNGVLFYISIGTKGLIIDPKQLKDSYASEGLPLDRAQFEPSPNSLLIKRYLNEIKNSYANHSQFRYKLKDIEELLALFN